MTDRQTFLARVRAAQPRAPEGLDADLPEVPLFPPPPEGDRLQRFGTALQAMGGHLVDDLEPQDLQDWLERRFGAGHALASAVPEARGNRPLTPATLPASLEDVHVGVVRARHGVAETGSVWLSEQEYIVNALGYLPQHLVVLLDAAAIVDGLQDIYRQPDFRSARFAALVTGPSATADIEGVLIRGAQGVRSLTVVLIAARAPSRSPG